MFADFYPKGDFSPIFSHIYLTGRAIIYGWTDGWVGLWRGAQRPFLHVKETIDGFAQRGQNLLVSNCLKMGHVVSFHGIKCAFNEEESRIFVPSVAVD